MGRERVCVFGSGREGVGVGRRPVTVWLSLQFFDGQEITQSERFDSSDINHQHLIHIPYLLAKL